MLDAIIMSSSNQRVIVLLKYWLEACNKKAHLTTRTIPVLIVCLDYAGINITFLRKRYPEVPLRAVSEPLEPFAIYVINTLECHGTKRMFNVIFVHFLHLITNKRLFSASLAGSTLTAGAITQVVKNRKSQTKSKNCLIS